MRLSYWCSDVCSSDLVSSTNSASQPAQHGTEQQQTADDDAAQHSDNLQLLAHGRQIVHPVGDEEKRQIADQENQIRKTAVPVVVFPGQRADRIEPAFDAHRQQRIQHGRSEEHTSELQSLMRISYAVFCLKKKKQ